MIEFVTFIIMLANSQVPVEEESVQEPVQVVEESTISSTSSAVTREALPQSYPQSYPPHMGIMCETALEDPSYRDPAIYCK